MVKIQCNFLYVYNGHQYKTIAIAVKMTPPHPNKIDWTPSKEPILLHRSPFEEICYCFERVS